MTTEEDKARREGVLATLREARNLVARGWTQGAAARTACGVDVPFDCAAAERFCIMGAVYRAALGGRADGFRPPDYLDTIDAALNEIAYHALGCDSDLLADLTITKYNDAADRSLAEVLDVMDSTIAFVGGAS